MSCEAFLARLHAYFAGELGADDRASLDAHAAGCRECGALMARAKELSCRDFVAFLDDYVDDALAPGRKTVFERHLEICEDCRNYLESYRATLQLSVLALRHSPLVDRPIPQDLVLAVLRAASAG